MRESIYNAAVHYCNYQERCHSEVKAKLAELGCYGTEATEVTASLIEAGHLNETRFATAYARGKFRMLAWGKSKIRFHLQQKGISTYDITKALAAICDNEYYKTAEKLAQRKKATLKSIHPAARKQKLYAYMTGKGYEPELLTDLLTEHK